MNTKKPLGFQVRRAIAAEDALQAITAERDALKAACVTAAMALESERTWYKNELGDVESETTKRATLMAIIACKAAMKGK